MSRGATLWRPDCLYFAESRVPRPCSRQLHRVSDCVSGRSPIKRVPKPWGHETIWAETESYVGKILHITAGQALSVQYHNVKDETVYLLSGQLIYRVWEGETPRDVDLKIGEAFRI